MTELNPSIDTKDVTLFEGGPSHVLPMLPDGLASMVLTIAPLYGTDLSKLDFIADQLLRVSAGPVLVLTPVYTDQWSAALGNAGIHRFDNIPFDLVAVNADDIDIPADPESISDLMRLLIEQAGSGTIIDAFARSWLIALPTILCSMKFVGVCAAGAEHQPQSVQESIIRKLDGRERGDGHPPSLKEAHRAH